MEILIQFQRADSERQRGGGTDLPKDAKRTPRFNRAGSQAAAPTAISIFRLCRTRGDKCVIPGPGYWMSPQLNLTPGAGQPHAGHLANVESLLGRWINDSSPQSDPGYNVILDGGDVVSVQWDWIAGV